MNDAVPVAGPRVALLARQGDARDRIGEALRAAGAALVMTADPQHSSPDEIRAAAPQAILVALDPSIEEALDRYDAVLADPAYMVIFEEAELAVQRVGWDAARWLRHLAAKLHRHDDVLPPGADIEQDLQPLPGPLPARAEVADLAGAIAAFADEAQQRAGDVPRDSGVAGLQGLPDDGVAPFQREDDRSDDAAASTPPPDGIASGRIVFAESVSDEHAPDENMLDEIVLDRTDWADTDGAQAHADAPVADASEVSPSRFGEFEWSDWQLADAGAAIPDDAQDDAAAGPSWDRPALLAPLDIVDDVAPEYDPSASELDADLIEAVAGLSLQARTETIEDDAFEVSTAEDQHMSTAPGTGEPGDRAAGTGLQLADVEDQVPGGSAAERVVREFDTSGLSLADDDAPALPGANIAAPQAPAFESSLSGLSLVDVDSYGHGPERGGVLVEAGLGGPDAVRQLLAEIPEGFPRPVFVRLRLDGGRYDRLVAQMERAAQLPVLLAQQGLAARPGTIYFLTPDVALQREKSELVFRRVDDGAEASQLPSALPPQDTAILFLSGSDVGLVAPATSEAWQGAIVAGQSDEGCYDATAAQALAARGGASATPTGLAQLLFDRWPSPNAPGGPASPGELTW